MASKHTLCFFLCYQLEERIDTLSKEARAQKSSAEASQILISELREELTQVSSCHTCAHAQVVRENRGMRTWYITVVLDSSTQPVRVAEWSKAPDSRSYLAHYVSSRLLVHVCGRGFESHL